MTKTVLIAGGSGFIGTELARQLEAEGHTPLILVRRPARTATERSWDPEAGWIKTSIIDGVDAVVNLSGASISRLPWTLPYKREILQSRLQATGTLAEAIRRSDSPPAVFLSGSAVGFYGDRPGETLTESSSQGTGFLAKVTDSWERAAAPAAEATRVVTMRTGLVIGKGGGALKPLALIAKAGLAGPLGSGEQIWPWVSLRDEAAAVRHLLDSSLEGPVNLVGPRPVAAAVVVRELTEKLGKPYWLPAPAWALKAALADAGRDLLLADQDVSSQKLMADGFEFADGTIGSALEQL
ncbi:TIGR01777 family oxidoreductase [Herbiconiux sp. CPCC 203407]|uniref:TIGR01777 family oxidoreductase n=1 Tax=Herbiconiux oxytropis TaxID=2970915 RepID=A0AA41XDD0_9MICO|nr:TIGR01777 family oxidoreductase [Herbiconiux oxytropis]MCS5720544.1 TIGR01777 family oxidoreductase [Herbiconiux oxytropis]MCS5726117.1 TIGR01777 family oxidoreductase [Herbiconiux oxytropis]